MGRAKETFGKREVQNRKDKKRKDKEKRKLERKEQGKQSADDMIAYVDEFGNITSTPPDPDKKEKIDASSIRLGVPNREVDENKFVSTGIIKNYDPAKGFGFIQSSGSNESIFIHINDCIDEIKNGDKVEFDTEKGPKGLKAKNVKLVK